MKEDKEDGWQEDGWKYNVLWGTCYIGILGFIAWVISLGMRK